MKYNAKTMEPYIPWGLAILVGMLVGFLAGYAKRKGENRAIHEDIDKLVDQVRAVTLATREIEAKISNDVWNRQKRWELKRDVLFEAAKRVAEVDEALVSLDWTLQVEQKLDDPVFIQSVYKKTKKWGDASAGFDEARLLVAIVCHKETIEAMDDFGLFVGQIATEITKNRDAEIRKKSAGELALKLFAARAAIRKELEMDKPA